MAREHGRARPLEASGRPMGMNVQALRPMRILLVSDDEQFAERLGEAARERTISFSAVSTGIDVDVELARNGSNIFVLDAEDALHRAARSATAFAALHPDIPVVVVVDRASSRTLGGFFLLDKWRSAERLLAEIELAFVGLRP